MSSRKTNNDESYFDDCPICQAQKRADEEGRLLGFRELQEAFEEAGRQGHFVGSIDSLPTITGRGGRA